MGRCDYAESDSVQTSQTLTICRRIFQAQLSQKNRTKNQALKRMVQKGPQTDSKLNDQFDREVTGHAKCAVQNVGNNTNAHRGLMIKHEADQQKLDKESH